MNTARKENEHKNETSCARTTRLNIGKRIPGNVRLAVPVNPAWGTLVGNEESIGKPTIHIDSDFPNGTGLAEGRLNYRGWPEMAQPKALSRSLLYLKPESDLRVDHESLRGMQK